MLEVHRELYESIQLVAILYKYCFGSLAQHENLYNEKEDQVHRRLKIIERIDYRFN